MALTFRKGSIIWKYRQVPELMTACMRSRQAHEKAKLSHRLCQSPLTLANNPVRPFHNECIRKVKRHPEDADALLDDRICREENPGTARKDILRYFFNTTDPKTGRRYSIQELREDSRILILAGTDTTAMTITASPFYFSA